TKGEPRVQLPGWAEEQAIKTANDYARRIEDTGVRIVGDITSLYAPQSPSTDIVNVTEPPSTDIAVQAILGAVKGAQNYERKLKRKLDKLQNANRKLRSKNERMRKSNRRVSQNSIVSQINKIPKQQRPQIVAKSLTTRTLVKSVIIRLAYKLRTGRSMPIKR